jgi:hypothetical protein
MLPMLMDSSVSKLRLSVGDDLLENSLCRKFQSESMLTELLLSHINMQVIKWIVYAPDPVGLNVLWTEMCCPSPYWTREDGNYTCKLYEL